jgi:cbb3-type cytochrome oxidase maturation protein
LVNINFRINNLELTTIKIMSIIYLLLAISLTMSMIFLGIFIYNLNKGQFDDDYTPAIRILFEDEKKKL